MSRFVLVTTLAAVFVLGLTASVLVYNSSQRVAASSTELIDRALTDLRIISRFRSELAEHERLSYELYAVIDAERFEPLLARQQQIVESQMPRLLDAGISSDEMDEVQRHWSTIVGEVSRLSDNIAGNPTDWDLARAQLKRISDERRAVSPLLDELVERAESRAHGAERRTGEDLALMSSLVTAYTVIILIIAAVVAWMVRRLFIANQANQALAQFPARNPMPVVTISRSGRVHYANRAAHEFAARIGSPDAAVEDLVTGSALHAMQAALTASDRGEEEAANNDRVLAYHWHWLADQQIIHVYIRDITAQRKAENRLRRLAFEDDITGLMNRNALLRAVDHQGDHPLCLCLISIERFDVLRFNAGFRAADRLLAAFARHLQPVAGKHLDDSVGIARIEGALFALVWTLRDDHDAGELAVESFMEALPRVLRSGREIFHADYRMGVRCLKVGETADPETLLSDADAALRTAERQTRSRHVIHDQSIRDEQQSILRIERRLRHAIDSNARGLELYLQPKVALESGSIVGAEALLRWHDEELGPITPDRFIPIAEQSGLIVDLGRWVTDRAIAILADWRSSPALRGLHLAINVAPQELQFADYPEHIIDALRRSGVDSQRLELEVTERVIADTDNIVRIDTLGRLSRAGVAVSVDDFGTGYSSLAYLSSLPISHIKIDRAFVSQLPPRDNQTSLARTIINLARELDLGSVAEGVETAEQAEYLRTAGCHLAQGYFFSPPLPRREFETMMAAPKRSQLT